MEDSSAASPAPVEAAAAPNPATEAPLAPLPAPEAGPEASALPAGAAVAPPRFDLHAAPDANLNLRLSPSEDAWGGALAFGANDDDDPLPLADVPGNPGTAALRRKAALYRIPSAAELEAVLPAAPAPVAAPELGRASPREDLDAIHERSDESSGDDAPSALSADARAKMLALRGDDASG